MKKVGTVKKVGTTKKVMTLNTYWASASCVGLFFYFPDFFE